ncbi:MAG: MFS transporter [Alphaproteobacteria bacterium]|nr:MFS transporter [Alphaproteobacteria bacterium]
MPTAKAVPHPSELTSLRTKLFYGFGSVSFGVKTNGFQTILLPFYNLVLGLPPQWVGAALGFALIFDAFLDPFVGQLSDNLHTRWGRRHPLMYASALPVALSYLLLWNPPALSKPELFAWLVVCAIITRTFITFYEIPSSALVPELTDDYDERTSFLAYRVFFGWYGGMTMLTLAYLVLLKPDATHKVGQLNEAGYHTYGLIAAIVMFAAIMISAAGTHRFIPLFRKPQVERQSLRAYSRQMLETLANRPFLILMVSTLLTSLATGLVFALTFYINTYFWRLSSEQIGILSFAIFLAVAIAFAISPPLSRRFGKKFAAISMFTIGGVIMMAPPVLALFGAFVPLSSPLLLPLLFAASTVGSALTIGPSIMVGAMIADVVEHSEITTGRRSEGLFFAGSSFLQKAVSGLGLLGSGVLLWAVGFPTHAVPGAVSNAVVIRFVIVYLGTTSALYAAGFAILARFPIDREDHRANLQALAGQSALAAPAISSDLALEVSTGAERAE